MSKRWVSTGYTSAVHMRCKWTEGVTEEWVDTKTGCTLLFTAKPFEFMNRWTIYKPNGHYLTQSNEYGVNDCQYLSEPNRPKIAPPTTWANKLIKKHYKQTP
jgi:hypothetical protein